MQQDASSKMFSTVIKFYYSLGSPTTINVYTHLHNHRAIGSQPSILTFKFVTSTLLYRKSKSVRVKTDQQKFLYFADKRWIQDSRYSDPYKGLCRPLGLQELEACRISTKSAYEDDKAVNPMYRSPLKLPSPGDTTGTHFCYKLSRSQGHSDAERIESLKNPKDHIGNRTRDQVYSAVPQPTTSL